MYSDSRAWHIGYSVDYASSRIADFRFLLVEITDSVLISRHSFPMYIIMQKSVYRVWERGHFNVTPHVWRRMAIMHVSRFFSLKNTLLFVRPLPTPTKYGTSKIISLFR